MDALPLLSDAERTSHTSNMRPGTSTPRNLSAATAKALPTTSTNSTTFQLLCTMAGTGILQLPFTIAQGGWCALILVALVGLITNWTGKLIISSLYLAAPDLSQPFHRLEGYPEIGRASFGLPGYVFVQFFHKATLFGVSSIFLILSAKFLTEGLGGDGEGLLNETSLFKDITHDWTKIWTVVSAVVGLMPLLFQRTMSENKLLSLLGALSTILVVGVIIAFAIILHPLSAEDSNHDDDAFVFSEPTHKMIDWTLFPSAFSAIVLSFGGAATFPSIERGMEKPKQFNNALNRAFVVLMMLYFSTAIAGYWTFGDLTFTPILCNLPRGDDFAGRFVQITKLFVAFHVMTAYPILMNALVTEIECKVPVFRPFLPRMLERCTMVGLTLVVALFLPFFGELMTLVGAGALTVIVFVLPVVFNFKLRSDRKLPIGVVEYVCGVFVVLMGLAGGSIGGVQAVKDLVAAFKSQ